MRVLLIARRFPPAPGGVENQAMEIARRLNRRGHQVDVYTSDLYSDIPPRRLPGEPSTYCDGIQIRRCTAVPIPFRKNSGTSITPTMLLETLAEKDFPRLVHSHGFNLVTISASLLAQRQRKSKVICTTHTDPSMLSGRSATKILLRFDGLVALTEIERAFMLKLGLDGSKIRVIPNGIDTQGFADLPPRDYFRRQLGLEGRIILYAGRIDSPTKGCDVLIEAVSIVQDQMGECVIVFAGPDWGSQKYLQALSSRKKVPVVFTGNLSPEELRAAFVACDVLVLPSLAESFGLSILEGMMCGAPIVATRVGGIPSIVHDEDTGLLVSPGDNRELAAAICRILDDGKLSAHLASNARKLAANYSIERTVAQLEKFYGEILKA